MCAPPRARSMPELHFGAQHGFQQAGPGVWERTDGALRTFFFVDDAKVRCCPRSCPRVRAANDRCCRSTVSSLIAATQRAGRTGRPGSRRASASRPAARAAPATRHRCPRSRRARTAACRASAPSSADRRAQRCCATTTCSLNGAQRLIHTVRTDTNQRVPIRTDTYRYEWARIDTDRGL